MAEATDGQHLVRKRLACNRCHTKRIKCIGGVPCRNCGLSSSPCTFPVRRGSRRESSQTQSQTQDGVPTGVSLQTDENAVAPPSLHHGYRRPEKRFGSRRLAPVSKRTYRGNPSCQTFVEQMIEWSHAQRLFIQQVIGSENQLSPSWTWSAVAMARNLDTTLSISIDVNDSSPVAASQASKPIKIRLPSYNYSMKLIDVLEAAIGHEQHFFLRNTLRRKVAFMHNNPEAPEAKSKAWLSHWLSIVSVGELYMDSYTLSSDGLREEYYQQAISLLQQVAETPDMEYIETLCLLTLYAFSQNRVNTAYMYVGVAMRAALALGLHRDAKDGTATQYKAPTPAQEEHGRRVFWNVYYLDLMATSATGTPWGILDGEITIDLPSSTSLQNENDAAEFFDAADANAHLDLMRLRSQAYSALYGYAGKDCTPHSHVSFFDHDLAWPLTQAHLDKIQEFHNGLVAWEKNLKPSLKLDVTKRVPDRSMSRVAGMLNLTYHQSVIVVLRPAFVQCYNHWFESHQKAMEEFPFSDEPNHATALPQALAHMYHVSFTTAKQMVQLLSRMWQAGQLSMLAYFEATYAFTAAITLYMARSIGFNRSGVISQIETSSDGIFFGQEDQAALDMILHLLHQQVTAGNISSRKYIALLDTLEANLNGLQEDIMKSATAMNFSQLDISSFAFQA